MVNEAGQVVESFGALCPYDCFKPSRQYCLWMEESKGALVIEFWTLNTAQDEGVIWKHSHQ